MGYMNGKPKRDWELLHEFERNLVSNQPPDPIKNLRIAEAMYEHARKLGILPLQDPLEGLEIDLKIARVINSVRNNPRQDS